jgi:glycosyltransferase involved in cell wall biosynthesis
MMHAPRLDSAHRPTVLLVWDADYPWDIRVQKFSDTLTAHGMRMHVLARNRRRLPPQETQGGLTIHRLPALPQWTGRLNDLVSFPAFINPVWARSIAQTARRVEPDLVIVRDLPLAPLTLWAGRRLGLPVMLDMAEAYPEMIRNVWLFGPWKLRNVLIRNPALAARVERYVIRRIDHILVVVEESRERLLALGADPDRITLVSNTPDPDRFDSAPSLPDTWLRVSYVGLLGYSRGLDVAIRGMAVYRDRGGRGRLDLYGTGKAEGQLRVLTRKLDLEEQVRFHGWLDNRELPRVMTEADVCVVPHRVCPHWQATIPNKLFDYMAAGRPVLVSDVQPMARIVGETGAGLIFRDNDPDDFARCLTELEDRGRRNQLGRQGRRAVETSYHWQHDATRLLDAIQRVVDASDGAQPGRRR